MTVPPRDANDPAAALAERVRDACLQAARDAYEDAGLSGLCPEGRWEAAQDAIRAVPLPAFIANLPQPHTPSKR